MEHRRGPRIRLLGAVLAAAALTGCSIVTANNRPMLEAREDMAQGRWPQALEAVDAGKFAERDALCGMLDRGVILQNQGRFQESNAEFDRAIRKIKEYEARAVISATEVAAAAGTMVLNDKTLEYQGQGYEKVLVHALKARNYLMLGDEESARVEIRNAEMRQEEERKKHEDAIEAARKEGEEKKVDVRGLSAQVDREFASSEPILKRLHNVYQNPFSAYLQGVVYELNGEPDLAFLQYRSAYWLYPSPLITSELVRLARKEDRLDELGKLGISAVPKAGPTRAGNTLVFVDNGFAPERTEIKFPIPTGDTLLFVALPMTRAIPTNLGEVEITEAAGARVLGRTDALVDIEAMSVRDLRDRYPGILIRQAIRLAARGVAANQARRSAEGDAAELAVMVGTSVFNAVVEQADLRAWYALPRTIHVARIDVPAGDREIRLRFLDPAGRPMSERVVPVTAANEHLNVVLVRYISGQVIVAAPDSGRVVAATQTGGSER